LPANSDTSVSQPSHTGRTTPVGAAEGCDLLISRPATISATSYKDQYRRPIASQSPDS